MPSALADRTATFFRETLRIGEAPAHLLNDLYATGILATSASIVAAKKSRDEDDFDPDLSMASIDGAGGVGNAAAGSAADEEEALLEAELFVDGVQLGAMEELSGLLHEWKCAGAGAFWDVLMAVAREPEIVGASSSADLLPPAITALRNNNKSGKLVSRRSSIRLSMAGGRASDTGAKGLVAICYRLMARASEGRTVAVGMEAAMVYLQLVSLPGTSVYRHIFTPIVLHDVIRLMQNYHQLLYPGDVNDEDRLMDEDVLDGDDASAASSSPGKNGRGRRTNAMLLDGDGDDDDTDDTAQAATTLHIMDGIMRAFPGFLADLKLKTVDESFKQITHMLIDLLQIHAHPSLDRISLTHKSTVERIRTHALDALRVLADVGGAAKLDERIAVIYRGLLPVILARHCADATSVPKGAVAQSELAVELVRSLTRAQSEANTAMDVDGGAERAEVRVSTSILKTYILAQHMAVSFVDKADHRVKTIHSIIAVLEVLPPQLQHRFTLWVSILGNNPKNGIRAFAVELSEAMLLGGAFEVSADIVDQTVLTLSQKLEDKSPTVRARALSVMASLFEASVNGQLQPTIAACITTFFDKFTVSANNTRVAMLSARLDDEKSVVRKAATSLARFLISFDLVRGSGVAESKAPVLIAALEQRFRDPVMTLRKSTVRLLSDLLMEYPDNTHLWSAWKRCVFIGAGDNETGVQEECCACVDDVIIQKLSASEVAYQRYLWPQFTDIPRAAEKCLRESLYQLSKKGINTDAIKYLQSVATAAGGQHGTTSGEQHGAWVLFACAAPYCPVAVNANTVIESWKSLLKQKRLGSPVARNILSVLETVVNKLNTRDANELLDQMVRMLSAFHVPLGTISAVVSTINMIDKCKNEKARVWCVDLLQTCETVLEAAVLQQEKRDENAEEYLVRVLFTVGEVSLFSPVNVTPKIVTNVQMLVASPEDLSLTTRARSFAFITLGKICLLNEDIAKHHVPVFARELETGADVAIRNNAMMVLSDLCKRYTRVVDQYIPTIANGLQDPSEEVRIQTLLALTKLLQEDYIKWKGSLFYKYVTAVVDTNRDIAGFARESLAQMTTKYPMMFYANFADCIYYLNDFIGGNVSVFYNRTPKERKAFAMHGGGENEAKRRAIYTFLLKNLADDQRFQLTRKLCMDVLRGALDGTINIADENGSNVIVDALYVLASKEIKCAPKITKADADGDDDAADTAENKLAALSTKIHSQISRKIAVENIIPIVIQLKQLMEQRRSPLLKQVMLYLREVVKDFRVEMEDIMVSDRQLAREIEFDLRQFEQQQKLTAPVVVATPAKIARATPVKAEVEEEDAAPAFKAPFPKLKKSDSAANLSSTTDDVVDKENTAEEDEVNAESTTAADDNDEQEVIATKKTKTHGARATPHKRMAVKSHAATPSAPEEPNNDVESRKRWKIKSPVVPPKERRPTRGSKRAAAAAVVDEDSD